MRQIRDSEYGVVVDRGNGVRAYGAECQLKLLPDAAQLLPLALSTTLPYPVQTLHAGK